MQQLRHPKKNKVLFVLFGAFLLVPLLGTAATTVTNSVSVSADSSGASESSVRVKTVVNGQVVEDWSATSSDTVRYTSSYRTDGADKITTTTVSERTLQSDTVLLQTLLAHLQVLIKLYVILNSL